MPNKTWKVIGPVTVKAANGASRSFDNLALAVKAVGEFNISRLVHGRLGYWSDWYVARYSWRQRDYHKSWSYAIHSRDGVAGAGDAFVFTDELGMTIPVWKVKETFEQVKDPPKVWSTIRMGYKWNRQKGKNKRTFGYHRDWSVEDWEEDGLSDTQVSRLANRGRPTHETAPFMWDECHLRGQRIKNWKVYRRTQYKKVN